MSLVLPRKSSLAEITNGIVSDGLKQIESLRVRLGHYDDSLKALQQSDFTERQEVVNKCKMNVMRFCLKLVRINEQLNLTIQDLAASLAALVPGLLQSPKRSPVGASFFLSISERNTKSWYFLIL